MYELVRCEADTSDGGVCLALMNRKGECPNQLNHLHHCMYCGEAFGNDFDAFGDHFDGCRYNLIHPAISNLRKGRWFIIERTAYGWGLFAPATQDVLELIEEGII